MNLPENPAFEDIAYLALVAAAKEASTFIELLQVAQTAKSFDNPQ